MERKKIIQNLFLLYIPAELRVNLVTNYILPIQSNRWTFQSNSWNIFDYKRFTLWKAKKRITFSTFFKLFRQVQSVRLAYKNLKFKNPSSVEFSVHRWSMVDWFSSTVAILIFFLFHIFFLFFWYKMPFLQCRSISLLPTNSN